MKNEMPKMENVIKVNMFRWLFMGMMAPNLTVPLIVRLLLSEFMR